MSHRLHWSMLTSRTLEAEAEGHASLAIDDDWCALVVETCRRDDQGVRIRVTMPVPYEQAPGLDDVVCAFCSRTLRLPPVPWEHPAERAGMN